MLFCCVVLVFFCSLSSLFCNKFALLGNQCTSKKKYVGILALLLLLVFFIIIITVAMRCPNRAKLQSIAPVPMWSARLHKGFVSCWMFHSSLTVHFFCWLTAWFPRCISVLKHTFTQFLWCLAFFHGNSQWRTVKGVRWGLQSGRMGAAESSMYVYHVPLCAAYSSTRLHWKILKFRGSFIMREILGTFEKCVGLSRNDENVFLIFL